MDRRAELSSGCGAPGEDRREAVLCIAWLASVRSNSHSASDVEFRVVWEWEEKA